MNEEHVLMSLMLGEIEIIHGIQRLLDTPAKISFAIFCARWLIFFLTVPVALIGLKRRHRPSRNAAYRAAWSALVALLLSLALGFLFGRIRPFHVSPDVHLLVQPPASVYSFPSSHASVAFAVAFALLYGDVTIGLLALLMAALIAFGRMAVGVHYPTDVFAGTFLGYIAFLVTGIVHQRFWMRRKAVGKQKTELTIPPSHEST